MGPLEYIVIILSAIFVVLVFGREIYKKIKKIPTGECACCSKSGSALVKSYRKKH